MKKSLLFLFILVITVLLSSCNAVRNKLYFDEHGIAFKENIALTKSEKLDIKEYVKVGDRLKNNKKIGSTSYEDLIYYVKDGDEAICSVSEDGIVNRLSYGNALISVKTKDDETDYSVIKNTNCIVVIFVDDDPFKNYNTINYLEDDELKEDEKKSSIVFDLDEDLTYYIIIHPGLFKFEDGSVLEFNYKEIYGRLDWSTNGLHITDDEDSSNNIYIKFKEKDGKLAIQTFIKINDEPIYKELLFTK